MSYGTTSSNNKPYRGELQKIAEQLCQAALGSGLKPCKWNICNRTEVWTA